jgi:hypothetical protein
VFALHVPFHRSRKPLLCLILYFCFARQGPESTERYLLFRNRRACVAVSTPSCCLNSQSDLPSRAEESILTSPVGLIVCLQAPWPAALDSIGGKAETKHVRMVVVVCVSGQSLVGQWVA